MSRDKKVILLIVSADGEMFELDESNGIESKTTKITSSDTDMVVHLPNVSSKILMKVVEYYKYHVESWKSSDEKPAVPDDEIKQWDAEFVNVDPNTLWELCDAAIYLNIESLSDLTCRSMADMLKDKTLEEIRKIFNIENDFTTEKEEDIRRQNEWALNELRLYNYLDGPILPSCLTVREEMTVIIKSLGSPEYSELESSTILRPDTTMD